MGFCIAASVFDIYILRKGHKPFTYFTGQIVFRIFFLLISGNRRVSITVFPDKISISVIVKFCG
jgi:hypothetical protein